ncbi:MAG TPA: aldo/keto reductase [Solirubrobacteraceae bacterium]
MAGNGAGARTRLRAVDRRLEFLGGRARAGDRSGDGATRHRPGPVSPFEFRRGLLEAADRSDVALVGYSTLGTGRHLSDPAVTSIAERLGRTPAQVLLRWCVQHEVPVIPKSTHRERIEENGQIFDFALTDEDMAALDGLDRTGGTSAAREGKWW